MPELIGGTEEYAGWNPRYVAYAHAHGRAPQAQAERDDREWAGGKMAGFMLWHQERVREFLELQPVHPPGLTAAECASWVLTAIPDVFDAWLKERSEELRKALDSQAPTA